MQFLRRFSGGFLALAAALAFGPGLAAQGTTGAIRGRIMSGADQAVAGAHEQWRYNVLGGDVNWELRSPEHFDTATRLVRPEDMRESVLISSDLNRHADWLAEFVELGFEELQLHQVDRNQSAFIDAFGTKVLPQLRR